MNDSHINKTWLIGNDPAPVVTVFNLFPRAPGCFYIYLEYTPALENLSDPDVMNGPVMAFIVEQPHTPLFWLEIGNSKNKEIISVPVGTVLMQNSVVKIPNMEAFYRKFTSFQLKRPLRFGPVPYRLIMNDACPPAIFDYYALRAKINYFPPANKLMQYGILPFYPLALLLGVSITTLALSGMLVTALLEIKVSFFRRKHKNQRQLNKP